MSATIDVAVAAVAVVYLSYTAAIAVSGGRHLLGIRIPWKGSLIVDQKGWTKTKNADSEIRMDDEKQICFPVP